MCSTLFVGGLPWRASRSLFAWGHCHLLRARKGSVYNGRFNHSLSGYKKEHKYPYEKAVNVLKRATIVPDVIASMERPAESLTWRKYQKIFLTPSRIKRGVEFWKAHRATFKRAQKKFGVPPEIIIAIIGVESFYGRHMGKHRVIDSLATLGFRYPRRAKFFRRELAEFLVLSHEEGLDPLTVKGSYAGAMGMPQFIPSSYRAYAVDFDADKSRDLVASVGDTIGSVGNYLHRHGWGAGKPIAYKAAIRGNAGVKADKKLKPKTYLRCN